MQPKNRSSQQTSISSLPRPNPTRAPNRGALHLHWKEDLLRLKPLPLLSHFKHSQHLEQCRCSVGAMVSGALPNLQLLFPAARHVRTLALTSHRGHKTLPSAFQKKKNRGTLSRTTQQLTTKINAKKRRAPLMQPLLTVSPVQKDGTPDPFLAAVAQVDFSWTTVNRKASPTRWRHAGYVLLRPISTQAKSDSGQFVF